MQAGDFVIGEPGAGGRHDDGGLIAEDATNDFRLGGAAGPFSETLIGEFQKNDLWIAGAFALEQGFLFTAMLLAAAVVGVIERRWNVAAAWCLCAAVLSATGLMHSYQWTFADTTLKLAPAWPFVVGYSAMALLFFTAQWTTEEGEGH